MGKAKKICIQKFVRKEGKEINVNGGSYKDITASELLNRFSILNHEVENAVSPQ